MERKDIDIHLKGIQTSQMCFKIISEIAKFILHQRNMIPYPYDYLRHIVTTRQGYISNPCTLNEMASCREWKRAEDFYNRLENILMVIKSEIETTENPIHEVAILLGSTVTLPSEAYIFHLPKSGWLRSEEISKSNLSNHIRSLRGNEELLYLRANLFEFWPVLFSPVLRLQRDVVMNNDLECLSSLVLHAPTPMYILFRKPREDNGSWLIPYENLNIRRRGVQLVNFRLENELADGIHPLTTDDSQADLVWYLACHHFTSYKHTKN